MSSVTAKANPPQAFISSYAPRIRTYGNSMLQPVIPQLTQIPPARTTKRGTTAINYAEDGYDDDDFEDSEGPRRRPTGLRSLRQQDDPQAKLGQDAAQLGKELTAPIDVQGIWREWMGKPKRALYVFASRLDSTRLADRFTAPRSSSRYSRICRSP